MDTKETYILPEEHSRTARVIGIAGIKRLEETHVAVFGVGGVGGHCAEALARAGIGQITLVDGDVVSLSNINRQAVALHSTVGRSKVEVMAERIRDINPRCLVTALHTYYLPDTVDIEALRVENFDYIADCVDSVVAKVQLAVLCQQKEIPLISAMAAGNKIYPERFTVTDLFKTNTDPLAKVMRRELRARGVSRLTVVCSDEVPVPVSPETVVSDNTEAPHVRPAPGSISFVPAVMGMIMAGEIIRSLSGIAEAQKAEEEARRLAEVERQMQATQKRRSGKGQTMQP